MVDAFSCIETPEMLAQYNAKTRRRIIKHSKEMEERDNMGLSYTTVPALKIARLAVAVEYQGMGLGKSLIQFSAYMGRKVKEMSGLAFLTLECFEHRVSFYESVGFFKNLIQPMI